MNGRTLRSRVQSNEQQNSIPESSSLQTPTPAGEGTEAPNDDSGPIVFTCDFCPRTFTYRKSLSKHIRNVHGQDNLPLACNLCSRTFADMALLNRHLIWHKGAQHQCRECGISYSHSKHLQRHMKKVHSAKKITNLSANTTSDKIESKPEIKPQEIKSQTVSPTNNTQVKSTNNSADTPPSDGKFLTYMELLQYVDKVPKPYTCQVCGKGTDSRRNYLEHYMSHSKERPFKCDVCGQGFIRERRMLDHRVIHERSAKKPRLDECVNSAFTDPSPQSEEKKTFLRTRLEKSVPPPSEPKQLRPRPDDSTVILLF